MVTKLRGHWWSQRGAPLGIYGDFQTEIFWKFAKPVPNPFSGPCWTITTWSLTHSQSISNQPSTSPQPVVSILEPLSFCHQPTGSQVVGHWLPSLIARFLGPTWGPSGTDRAQVGPMLAPSTLISGNCSAATKMYKFVNSMMTPLSLHQIETSSVLLALCEGNSPVTGEFPSQRPVT